RKEQRRLARLVGDRGSAIVEAKAVGVADPATDVERLGRRLERMHGRQALPGEALEHGRVEPEMRADVDERAAVDAVRDREQRRERLGLVSGDALAHEPALQPGLLAVED